jgi:hypothetical protein
MNRAARLLRVAASSAGLLLLGCVLTGYAARPTKHRISLPTDWSHQHLIFSHASSPEAESLLLNDPRYLQQMLRRSAALRPTRLTDGRLVSPEELALRAGQQKKKEEQGLWSIDIGSLSGSAGPGAGNYPAKFSFDVNEANCVTDFVIYSTGLAGGVVQPDVVAFNNLYEGCGGTVPSAYWAFNTGGSLLTSPTLSQDGTQVAFAESNAGVGVLVLLKWAATGSLTPGLLNTVSASGYRACTAACMVTFPLIDKGTAADDTTSSVYIDYAGDVAWVGDSLGYLHKFTGVFKGTPAESGSPFPVQVRPAHPGTPITSPVYDSVSGLVFVADGAGSSGLYGSLFAVGATSGTTTISSSVDHGVGIVEAPIVDSASQEVYVFSSSFNTLNGPHTNDCGTPPCAGVSQFPTTFAGGSTGNQITAGDSSSTPNPLYIGAFDSTYLDSSGSSRNGYMYVCGNTGGPPTLYQIQFTNGAFASFEATALTRLAIPSSTAACSPVTDFNNVNLSSTSTEHLFVSLPTDGRESTCNTEGCIMSFLDTQWLPSTAYTVGEEILDTNFRVETVVTAGTSGTTVPTWPPHGGLETTEPSGLTWVSQGFLSAADIPAWAPSKSYATIGLRTVDSNGNFEVVTVAGTTGTTQPVWPTTIGATIGDGTITWINAGRDLRGGIQIPGGTTGVVIDNAVTTESGASQVYFGTLTNQTVCTTSGGSGACAIQASQAGLQ